MVEYEFYQKEYMGVSIPEAEFPRLSKRAGEQLARYRRVYLVQTPYEGAESMAVCAIADALYYFETVQNGGTVASSKIGSVSVSYANSTVDTTPKAQEAELYRCACLYLDIYRGCGG